ncbi:MAG: sulfotransferase [Pseudomonadota bacterium]
MYDAIRNNTQFNSDFEKPEFSQSGQIMARRQSETSPVIFLHGVTTRSGTNYLNALLAKHPKLDSCPGQVYEFPMLTHLDKFVDFQDIALDDFARNREYIERDDIIVSLGSGLVSYLYELTEDGKIPLLKEPSVRNLRLFPKLFPGQKLLLLIRDGRDVVQSALTSWPGTSFRAASVSWARSAELLLNYNDAYSGEGGCLLVRYEDLVENTQDEMERVCDFLEIDSTIYREDIDKEIPIIGSSTHSKRGNRVSWKAVEKSDDFKHKNKWSDWNSSKRAKFKSYAGHALIQAGYESGDDW